MIDTLKLRVHAINDVKKGTQEEIAANNGYGSIYAVPEHNDLYKRMLEYKGRNHHSKQYVAREIAEVSDSSLDEFLIENNTKQFNVHQQTRNVMKFVDEKTVKEVNMSIHGSYRVPSSYNGITYRINESAGYIDFQFSIPKYLYGHSLAEFIPQINSDLHEGNFLKSHSWNFQRKHLHTRLSKFIDIFIEDLCTFFSLEALLNKRYIEVRRIDLCFNQHFNSKDDSLRYLEHLKAINYKRHKSNQKAPREYNTSLEYHSSTGSYFKIYHKGTEYSLSKDGDLKKHLQENKKYLDKHFKKKLLSTQNQKSRAYLKSIYIDAEQILVKMSRGDFSKENYDEKRLKIIAKLYKGLPYKVDFFKKVTDKILRYEVSLTGQALSYYYKHKVFRKDCEIHTTSYLKWKKVESINDSRNKKQQATLKENRNHKMLNTYLNRKVSLMLDTNPLLKSFEKRGNIDYNSARNIYKVSSFGLNNTLLENKDVGTFSDELLRWMVNYFKRIVDSYQVDTITPDEDLESRITEYNNKVDIMIFDYNERNHYKIYDSKGQNIIKSNRKITQPVQLLTQKQKSELGLKKIRPLIMIGISEQMKRGKSLRQVRKTLTISNSQWSRYKKDLEKFGITEKSRVDPEPIRTYKDFGFIYSLLGDFDFYSKFYVNKSHSYYG